MIRIAHSKCVYAEGTQLGAQTQFIGPSRPNRRDIRKDIAGTLCRVCIGTWILNDGLRFGISDLDLTILFELILVTIAP